MRLPSSYLPIHQHQHQQQQSIFKGFIQKQIQHTNRRAGSLNESGDQRDVGGAGL